ncbi:MAG: tetratricopeptide repeat protein, partial [Gammaproteobacteria bacterium]|nr:tetratricopeptide repeat protein [Gammaproteobacteria bacterium]
DRQADLAEYPIKDIAAVLQARLQQDEGSPQSWLLLGLLYSQANKMDVAITAFEKATQEAPDHPNIKIAYAEALIKQNNGNMGRASIRLLQEALQLSPDNPRALTVMGMGLYNSGLYQQAIETWQRLLALRGESSERAPLLRKAIQTARQAMAKSATDGSNIARQSRPNGEITASNSLSDNEARLRQLVMQERRLTPEIEALLKAIFESDADNSKALAFQGMLSFNSGQYQRAIDSWEALLKQREPGSERRKLVESSIEKARAKLAEAE